MEVEQKLVALQNKIKQERDGGQTVDPKDYEERDQLREQRSELTRLQTERDLDRFQGDWAARVENNGKVSGVFTDYHYYGTGDIGGSPEKIP